MSNAVRTCLGFDYGTKVIGVAVGQTLTGTAQPLKALHAGQENQLWQAIDATVQEWQPHVLVLGLPLNMDGSEQPITKNAKAFGQVLAERYTLPVALVDERCSTVEAKERLFSEGGYRNLRKAHIDAMSACVICEQWLAEVSAQGGDLG